MRIAHLSDLHLLSPGGLALADLGGKRLTGAINLLFKRRGRVYRPEHVAALLAEAARSADHVVITGDLTNLSLAAEFEQALALLGGPGLGPERVTVVPGNHDVYTPGAWLRGLHRRFLDPFQQGDLAGLGVELRSGRFPFVRLRGPAAIIGLSSAVPRPPFVAGGRLGEEQLAALALALEHPEVRRRTPVVLVHHPPARRLTRAGAWLDGLEDGEALLARLAGLQRGLVLHGHLHLRARRPLGGPGLEQLGATSAALEHPHPAARAALNLYRLDEEGRLAEAFSQVLRPGGGSFERAEIPRGGP